MKKLNSLDSFGAAKKYLSIITPCCTLLWCQQTVFLWHFSQKVMDVSGHPFAPSGGNFIKHYQSQQA